MDTRHSGGQGAIIKFYKWACAQAVAYAERRRRGGEGTEKAKIKKRDMHQKQGQKPRRIALRRVGGACSFAAFSILPLRLRDHHCAAPVPQIQTNSSGSYRRSNKCRTFTFSSEGSATVSPPLPLPHHRPTHSCLHRNPRAFRRCLFFSNSPVRVFFLALAFPLTDRAR